MTNDRFEMIHTVEEAGLRISIVIGDRGSDPLNDVLDVSVEIESQRLVCAAVFATPVSLQQLVANHDWAEEPYWVFPDLVVLRSLSTRTIVDAVKAIVAEGDATTILGCRDWENDIDGQRG